MSPSSIMRLQKKKKELVVACRECSTPEMTKWMKCPFMSNNSKISAPVFQCVAEFLEDFHETIIRWKRMHSLNARINAPNIESHLAGAFRARDGMERIEALCSIRGVGPALASILLALTYPEEYAPLDSHAWNALCRLGLDLPSRPFSGGGYTIPELLDYLRIIGILADQSKTTPWSIAKALHALDKVEIDKKWKRELTSLRSTSKESVQTTIPCVLGA